METKNKFSLLKDEMQNTTSEEAHSPMKTDQKLLDLLKKE